MSQRRFGSASKRVLALEFPNSPPELGGFGPQKVCLCVTENIYFAESEVKNLLVQANKSKA